MRPTAEQRRIMKRMELWARLTRAAKQALLFWLGINAFLIAYSAISGGALPRWHDFWRMTLSYPFLLLLFATDRIRPSRRKRGDRL